MLESRSPSEITSVRMGRFSAEKYWPIDSAMLFCILRDNSVNRLITRVNWSVPIIWLKKPFKRVSASDSQFLHAASGSKVEFRRSANFAVLQSNPTDTIPVALELLGCQIKPINDGRSRTNDVATS
jgi:hypothetical protein